MQSVIRACTVQVASAPKKAAGEAADRTRGRLAAGVWPEGHRQSAEGAAARLAWCICSSCGRVHS